MHGQYIVSIKVDDRGFVVHKWTKKIVDLKQVYLVVKDNRKIYQLALEFALRPGEKKPFTDVLQFDPATSRHFTQIISTTRKELLKRNTGGDGAAPQRFSDKYRRRCLPSGRTSSGSSRSSQPPRRSTRSSPPVPSPTRSRARSPTLKTAPTPRFSRRRPPRILSPRPRRLRLRLPTPSTTPSPLRCPCPRAPARASTADPAR